MHIVLFLENQRQLVAVKEQKKKKILTVRNKPADYLIWHLQSEHGATTSIIWDFLSYFNLPCFYEFSVEIQIGTSDICQSFLNHLFMSVFVLQGHQVLFTHPSKKPYGRTIPLSSPIMKLFLGLKILEVWLFKFWQDLNHNDFFHFAKIHQYYVVWTDNQPFIEMC